MIQLELPTPLSVNALYKNIPKKKGVKRRGRAITEEYSAWKDLAGHLLNTQHPPELKGPVRLTYQFTTSSRADLGNLEKCVTDLLVKHRVIEDDKPAIVKSITLEWSESVAGCRVTIKPYQGETK